MCYLYINDHQGVVGIKENRVEVRSGEEIVSSVPIETLESICVYSKAQITTQCIEECMRRDIGISYFSGNGGCYGRVDSLAKANTYRQRLQCKLYEADFSLELGIKIIKAKVNNQLTVIRRYYRDRAENPEIEEGIKLIKCCEKCVSCSESIEQLMGYEGVIAKAYFGILAMLINDDFRFTGRSKRPPKDEFNALISFGYSIISNELYIKLLDKGLNPYFGFVHRDKLHHPTLVSDLIEEWRPVIIDSLAMSLINGNEISKKCFDYNEQGGVYLNNQGRKIFLEKYEKRMRTKTRYVSEFTEKIDFRRAMEYQVSSLVRAIEQEDYTAYKTLEIR